MNRLLGPATNAGVVKQYAAQFWGKARISVIAVLGVASIAAPSFARAEQSRSLVDTVEKAILTHPEVQARYHDFLTTLEGQNIERGALRPQVSAEAWTGREWRTGSSTDPSTNWSRNGYSLQLSQLLFDGFRTLNTVRERGFDKVAAYFTLLQTVDSIALEAAQAHLDVILYRELERLAKENYQAHLDTHAQIQERQESGVGRGVDFEQSRGRLALAQSNLMTESANLNDVSQRYQRLVGELPAPVLLDAPNIAHWLPVKPENFLRELRSNPELLAKQALVHSEGSAFAAAKGLHMPTLELRASTGKDHSQPGLPYRDAHSSNVRLVMSYALSRGGADQARIRQTKAQQYAARDVRDYTCRNIQQELAIAWNNIFKVREQLPYLRQHMEATTRVRTAYKQQFQIGERSLLDVLDTENELFDARRSLVIAEINLAREELRWLMRSHRLLQALSLSQPFEQVPAEVAKLDFPDEAAQACATGVPDVDRLQPVVVEYQEALQPPILRSLD
ncbi:MAG TPA: TolC family outer membrane protein [Burkholderiaceae bacterium]|nr:TolC family outer membrane protein [Burkholderiaceae bacterium]